MFAAWFPGLSHHCMVCFGTHRLTPEVAFPCFHVPFPFPSDLEDQKPLKWLRSLLIDGKTKLLSRVWDTLKSSFVLNQLTMYFEVKGQQSLLSHELTWPCMTSRANWLDNHSCQLGVLETSDFHTESLVPIMLPCMVAIFLTAELHWEPLPSIYPLGPANEVSLKMTNVYHFDGLIIFTLLVICTCAYIKRVPRLKQLFLSEKKGLFGALYKAAVIGTRLHWAVSIACVVMAFYIIL